MKKKVLTKLAAMFLVVAIFVTTGSVSVFAGESADKILKNALKEMQAAECISYSYTRVRNYTDSRGKSVRYRDGIGMSDNQMDYGMCFDESQSEKAWIDYSFKDNYYRKAYNSNSFSTYTNYDYDEEQGTDKKSFEYDLAHLQDIEIVGMTKRDYKISGKPGYKDAGWKKVTLFINKKTGRLTGAKYIAAKATYSYIDSGEKYTVTGGSSTYSNISYGDTPLSLPDELKGR